MTENIFIKVNGTNLNVSTENNSQVYEYVLDFPLAFKEGDILGYFQPRKNRSEIDLYLENSKRLTTYFMRLGINDLYSPASGALFSINNATSTDTRYPVIAVRTGICRQIAAYHQACAYNIVQLIYL